MRINFVIDGVLISAKENEGKEGKKYYNVSIENSDEAGTVSCTEDLYLKIKSGVYPKYKTYRFQGMVNTQYNSLNIQRILPDEDEKKK